MRLMLTSTDDVAELDGVRTRAYAAVVVREDGSAGAKCMVFVHRIMVFEGEDQADFVQLQEVDAPEKLTTTITIESWGRPFP